MNVQIATPDRQPIVFAQDGAVFASSRDVAAFFEKRHDNVMRDIERLIEQEPSLGAGHSLSFEEMAVEVEIGSGAKRQTKAYAMTRDGFTLLAMGFTGAKALQWKLRYIAAFNQLEAEVRSPPARLPDLTDPTVLVPLLTSYAQRTQIAEGKVAELSPKAEAYDLLDASEGAVNVRTAAKMLGAPERKFTAWLQANRWAFRQNGIGTLQAYVEKRNSGYLEHRSHTYFDRGKGEDRTVAQMMITPKGLARLARIFSKEGMPK